jgi:deazaflavin-dependent oxidoreductase (nitroreductase family)
MPLEPALASEPYCYLTTAGRVTGKPHTVEIWFGLQGDTLYLLSGNRERSDWVRNLRRRPEVRVRLIERTYEARGRVVMDEAEATLARRLLFEKYNPGYARDLSNWRDTALPVALDVRA